MSRATLYVGDALEVLRTLPDESVQCCVTSPPYWGLRDYGTGRWEGGAGDCDHTRLNPREDHSHGEYLGTRDRQAASIANASPQLQTCKRCGATRVDRQMGLERTPEEYVERLVAMFREVRRVLRDDGTLWIVLGSSYASGGMSPSPSPLLGRVPACDSDGKGLQGSRSAGHACPDSGGELQGETRTHRDHIARSGQCEPLGGLPTSRTTRGSEQAGYAPGPPDASPLAVQASTTPESFCQLPSDAFCPSATASASQQQTQTSSHDALSSEHKSACISGTARMSRPLVVRTSGKESFFSACGHSNCKGVGRCGLCWCNLAIPSLGLKAKDDITIPHLVAMALRADGWYLRSDIIWSKPNPMPESVTDRPTKAHEYVFLFSKSQRYFYDADAIAEQTVKEGQVLHSYGTGAKDREDVSDVNDRRTRIGLANWNKPVPPTKNARTVWTITTRPYPNAHFATFPPELAERCIKAGTSQKGCCAECGAPWERVVERSKFEQQSIATKSGTMEGMRRNDGDRNLGGQQFSQFKQQNPDRFVGWQPTCNHDGDPVPCTVLDPFGGSGTAASVATGLGRNAIHIDLNPEYLEMAVDRIGPLLVDVKEAAA